ncbi:MAG: 2-amino-4-hydroxy-6-hydroxymethyldihydropteridine diphosphokinase [Syntrophorhabdales bacterium]|jgi:2-amino-4-hydroxy-6-hydroxymethyldihydropteridine diphosphokinase
MAGVAFIGAGSNIDPFENLIRGLKRIMDNERAAPVALSSFYRTSPVSPIVQNDFLNCALKIDWKDSPRELLAFLQAVEKGLGRTRTERFGPRTLDLDILLFGDLVMDAPGLTIPHPRLHERRFAIVPCLEIEQGLVHPRLGGPLSEWLDRVGPGQEIAFFRKVSLEEIAAVE